MIKVLNCLTLFCLLVYSGFGNANDHLLKVSPQKCVTLKEGNLCYQDIEVSWKTDEKKDYCLVLSPSDEPLQCWLNESSANYEFEFVGSSTSVLMLIEQHSGKLLQQTNIDVKWVYRNRSRNLSWRVF